MAERSTIEWTDATWNPVTGCSVVSPGCTNCYAMRLAGTRLRHHPSRAGLTVESKAGPVWNGWVRLNEEWLGEPLRWKRPRMIFVCAHGDLFHESVPDEWIDRVFAVMALSTQHTFQVLTKRSARMRAYVSMARAHPVGLEAMEQTLRSHAGDPRSKVGAGVTLQGDIAHLKTWPLPNVWLGVSAERQYEAEDRIPDLLDTPAAVRFLSAEPLLGPIDLTHLYHRATTSMTDALEGMTEHPVYPSDDGFAAVCPEYRRVARLDWVIAGGESGQGARPMHPDWARQLRDQCAAAGVPFFFKQWGSHLGGEGDDGGDAVWFTAASSARDNRWLRNEDDFGWFDPNEVPDGPMHVRLGKKAAGRLLDGVEHNAMPEPRP